MNPWILGGLLTIALLAGFAAGWFGMRRLGVAMPNAWVSILVLLAGSLGAPAVTYHALGPTPVSYVAALLAAGFAAGTTFWPMGEKQGRRQLL